MQNQLLENKTALITGAGRGIGKAIALAFAQAGADVILVSRTATELQKVADEIAGFGRQAWPRTFDLSQLDDIAGFYAQITAQTGPVDILVNVAGVIHRAASLDFPADKWQQALNVNLSAPFRLCQCFARDRVAAQKPGKIINITSLLAEAGRASIPAYAASKSGLKILTQTLAVEWAQYHINVNAIGPGYIETELTEPLVNNEPFTSWVLSKTPMQRWGTPGDLTGAALFLASAQADFITGQTIYVDGGWLAQI
ncbi:MAG TPA: SDR family oxidoreductase [bacterium]|nr:SDR family oxidoreductase [bacterium]HPN43719.1 SDR family oxidoreductase [bacterium]